MVHIKIAGEKKQKLVVCIDGFQNISVAGTHILRLDELTTYGRAVIASGFRNTSS